MKVIFYPWLFKISDKNTIVGFTILTLNFNDVFRNLFAEFIDKLHSTYQALVSGTYRPGQIVVALPTLTRPTQHKSAPLPPQAAADAAQANSGDGVEVHSFLEAILQIIHASGGSFRCFFCISCSFSHLEVIFSVFCEVVSLRCPVIGLISCYFDWCMKKLIKSFGLPAFEKKKTVEELSILIYSCVSNNIKLMLFASLRRYWF